MSTAIYEIQQAKTDEEILQCFEILQTLRPHLKKETFVEQVRLQETQGYRLIYIADGTNVKSVAGYRYTNFLAWGKVLYIDDLITSPEARGIGFGTHLLKWLMSESKKLGCNGVHLDTHINMVSNVT